MFFYNLGIRAYVLIIRIATLFNAKAKLWLKGRENYFYNLPKTEKDVIWFHCASLGEFEQGRPIIEEWKRKNPQDYILVTFFSPSGYEIRKDYAGADLVKYLPADTPRNAKQFIKHFNPKHAFFIKYEFWLNYIFAAKKNGTKLHALSAIFRSKQRFFKWYGNNFRKGLACFDNFFVQNTESVELLNSIGIQECVLSGDTRYDRVYENAQKVNDIAVIKNWLDNEKALIIGSSWEKDEEILADLINTNYSGKIIIAPHEIKPAHIDFIEKTFASKNTERYTLINPTIKTDTEILILDCIGILANVYQYGKFAYVGGAFGSGLHNILEPAIFGLTVIFGNRHGRFPEAQLFIDNGIGFSINDSKELISTVEKIESELKLLQEKTKAFTEAKRGAKAIIFKNLS